MVTLKGYTANLNGLSTDSKPTTGVDINTIFRELNTNKYYYFDGTTWNEIPNTGGGGGGGDITSENVIAMSGYEIAEEAGAIETTDTLNEAIGKLEKGESINETNISNCSTKLTGVDSTANNAIKMNNGVTLYFGSTTPSNPQNGDWWLD